MSQTNSSLISSILRRKVSQYMRPVSQLDEQILIPQACQVLQKRKTDEIVVVDNLGHPVGIVTDEDILKKIGEAYAKPERTSLGDIMSFPVISVKHDATLNTALELMRKNKIRKIAVVSDDDKVLGIIFQSTINNLIRTAILRPKTLVSHFKPILWNLGMVLQFAGALMIIPGVIATLQKDADIATGIYLMSVSLLITGFLMNSYGEKHPLSLRGTAILVFSSFMILVLFGMIPHLYVTPFDSSDPVELFADGFFESSHGFTTGGLSMVANPEDLPRSFTFYRSYTQFVGGLSFIYLIVTIFYPENRLNAMKGFVSGHTPRLRELFVTITIIFSIYLLIVALLLSYFGERDIMDNFALAMSGISTGGWVPDSQVFEGLTTPEYVVIIAAMILGALPFSFHYAFVRTKFLSVNITREVAVYFVMLVIFCTIFILSMDADPIDSIFNMISGSTTTGYQTINLENLPPIPFTVMIIAMMIGGCGFATSGGMKVFRLVQLAKLRYIFHRKAWNSISSSDKKDIIAGIIILAVSVTVPLYVANHMVSLGYDFQNAFFDSISAITTTGLGAGTISIDLDPFTKIVFGFLTILGRIEIILLIYIFVPKLMK